MPSHRIPSSVVFVVTLALFGQAASAQCDVASLSLQAEAITAPFPAVQGSSVWLESADGTLSLTDHFGTYDDDTVVAVASATKLLSGVLILNLVDAGYFTLDTTVGEVLPEFTGVSATITLRQLFSHTSGYPSQVPSIYDESLTLAEAVTLIATTVPLEAAPGTQFVYGGVSMHIAGRMAEVVTGQDWQTLFLQRIASPLGLTQTDYQGLEPTANYLISGGARSSVADYQRVLRMLRDGGVAPDGTVILSPEALSQLVADQTAGATIVDSPYDGVTRYGIGCWRDRVSADGTAVRISSPGAFGCTPWVDLDLGVAGLYFVRYLLAPIRDDVLALEASVRHEALACLSITPFLRGDANGDGTLNVADSVRTLGMLFGPLLLPCRDAADANDDGAVDISDAVFSLSRLFLGDAPPPPPFPECGPDPTRDALDCATEPDLAACPG